MAAGSRAQVPDESARGRLREGLTPESAAVLFQAVLNGLQLQWVLDQDLDIVGPVTDFVRLLFEQGDARQRSLGRRPARLVRDPGAEQCLLVVPQPALSARPRSSLWRRSRRAGVVRARGSR
ncbi:hypothetical protein [Streptomyces gilvus]|uniref:hypothetical protein n=1 Tax=Streptomyces gilvus TaxID=2920937 RepID=UPI0035A8396E